MRKQVTTHDHRRGPQVGLGQSRPSMTTRPPTTTPKVTTRIRQPQMTSQARTCSPAGLRSARTCPSSARSASAPAWSRSTARSHAWPKDATTWPATTRTWSTPRTWPSSSPTKWPRRPTPARTRSRRPTPASSPIVGSSCVQPAYRERPHARLRRLQGHTFGFTTADANPTTRAWLVGLEAEAHALAGNEAASLRALDQAETIVSGAGEEDAARRPRTAFFDRARLVGERGVALARLGRPAAARQVLEAALGSLDPEMVKIRPRLLSALATAHVQEGNVDEACRIGADALALADRQQVTTNLQDVRRLRLDLEPWRDTHAVRELDEQLAAVGHG